jgi:hypothetical protein
MGTVGGLTIAGDTTRPSSLLSAVLDQPPLNHPEER